jgi:hypothetical protein
MSIVTKTSTTPIAVDAATVWNALDDGFLNVSKWAGGVTSSGANPQTPNGFNGSQHGGRICEVDGVGTTDERIIAFDAAKRSLTYSIAAKGLPFFVVSLQNKWTVREDGPSSSIVDVEIQAVTKGIMGAIGALPMGRMLGKGAVGLPADLKKYLEGVSA